MGFVLRDGQLERPGVDRKFVCTLYFLPSTRRFSNSIRDGASEIGLNYLSSKFSVLGRHISNLQRRNRGSPCLLRRGLRVKNRDAISVNGSQTSLVTSAQPSRLQPRPLSFS
jgi:hypothetical protein